MSLVGQYSTKGACGGEVYPQNGPGVVCLPLCWKDGNKPSLFLWNLVLRTEKNGLSLSILNTDLKEPFLVPSV